MIEIFLVFSERASAQARASASKRGATKLGAASPRNATAAVGSESVVEMAVSCDVWSICVICSRSALKLYVNALLSP